MLADYAGWAGLAGCAARFFPGNASSSSSSSARQASRLQTSIERNRYSRTPKRPVPLHVAPLTLWSLPARLAKLYGRGRSTGIIGPPAPNQATSPSWEPKGNAILTWASRHLLGSSAMLNVLAEPICARRLVLCSISVRYCAVRGITECDYRMQYKHRYQWFAISRAMQCEVLQNATTVWNTRDVISSQ